MGSWPSLNFRKSKKSKMAYTFLWYAPDIHYTYKFRIQVQTMFEKLKVRLFFIRKAYIFPWTHRNNWSLISTIWSILISMVKHIKQRLTDSQKKIKFVPWKKLKDAGTALGHIACMPNHTNERNSKFRSGSVADPLKVNQCRIGLDKCWKNLKNKTKQNRKAVQIDPWWICGLYLPIWWVLAVPRWGAAATAWTVSWQIWVVTDPISVTLESTLDQLGMPIQSDQTDFSPILVEITPGSSFLPIRLAPVDP